MHVSAPSPAEFFADRCCSYDRTKKRIFVQKLPDGIIFYITRYWQECWPSYWFKCTDRVKYTVSTKLLSQQYFSTLYRSLCSSALVDSELTRPAGAASSLVCTACLEGTYGTGLVAPLQWMGIGCGGQCCRCSTFDIPDLSCPEFEESNCLCQRFTCWAVHRKKTSVCIQEAAHALCVLLDHILHQRVR